MQHLIPVFIGKRELRKVGSARSIVIIRIAADAHKIFNKADDKAKKAGEIFDQILNSLTHGNRTSLCSFFLYRITSWYILQVF